MAQKQPLRPAATYLTGLPRSMAAMLQIKASALAAMILLANLQVAAGSRGCVSDCINDRGGMENYVRYQINDDESECPYRLCVNRGQSYEDFTHPNHDAIDKYGQTAVSLNTLVPDRQQAWADAYNNHISNGSTNCFGLCIAIVTGLFSIVAACTGSSSCFCTVCHSCSGCQHGEWHPELLHAPQMSNATLLHM